MNQKVCGGEAASQFWYKLWQNNLEIPWWRGGEHIQAGSLWRIGIQNSLVARWRAISDTSFEISSMKNHWWRGGEHIPTVSLWIIWIKKSVVARWRASFDTSFDKSILKILFCEVASIYKQALFEEYEFKIPRWRGGEPFLTLALKYYPWKIIGGKVASQFWYLLWQISLENPRWRAYPNRLSLKNMNSKFPGGEVASHFWH